ncbi:MAG: Hint domain-containing protein, partial [Albidovulum sp.]|uniref:Hint domain-containing protein n=1 Tax=Albidovulum sp. TaxID=1872424 RepID=UPI003CC4909A
AAVEIADLLAAKPVEQDNVIYYHILFDAHEIVWANGCWSESFHPAAETLNGLHNAQRDEILTIFPELETEEGLRAFAPARIGLRREAPQLRLVA